MTETHPEFIIADANYYTASGSEGFVIVRDVGLKGPDGPIYVWPVDWRDYPERKGVFKTLQDAQKAMGMAEK
jgi:hypothetical protein